MGIKATLKGFPSGSYYTNFAGAPAYVHSHGIGISMGGWFPDWPDGFGFLDSLVDGATIVPTGNTNIAELNDPVINNLFAKSATLSSADRDADLGADRQAGHVRRRHLADGLRQVAVLPADERHQRLRIGRLRRVQLFRPRCEVLNPGRVPRSVNEFDVQRAGEGAAAGRGATSPARRRRRTR